MEHTIRIIFSSFPGTADDRQALEIQLTQWRNLGGWEIKGTSVLRTDSGAYIMYTLETDQASPNMTGMDEYGKSPIL